MNYLLNFICKYLFFQYLFYKNELNLSNANDWEGQFETTYIYL